MVSACSAQNRVITWAALDGVTGPGVIRLVTTFEPVIASTTGNLVRAAPTKDSVVIDRTFQSVVAVCAIDCTQGTGMTAEIERACLNFSFLDFQLRISSQACRSAQVIRCSHIGSGDL
ncbi:hypothetical protein D3C81_1250080 [compost metagenome]